MNNNENPQVKTEELVDTFSSIDNRIAELHEHSSGVFMKLNSYLKDYYKKINIISENASRIFDAILGEGKNNLLNELDVLYNRIKDYRNLAEEENRRSVKQLSEINLKTRYLFVAIRNFKQDLITFKYLTTNYRLVSNYEKFDSDWNFSLEKWEGIINNIHPALTKAGMDIDELKHQIINYVDKSEVSNNDSSQSISVLSDDIKSIYNNVLEKSQQSEKYFPVLKEKSKKSSDSIGNIITHLQYHDIIRQKIEHIQQYHQKVVDALKNEENLQKGIQTNTPDRKLGQIADIVGLQAEQLILVSREYQNALEVITRNFQIIADDISTISDISNEFCSDEKNRDITLLTHVKNKLDEGILMLDITNIGLINRDLILVREKIQNIHALTVSDITEPLNQLEATELFNGLSINPSTAQANSSPSILLQITGLAKDISDKKNDLLIRINELLELSEKFSTSADNSGLGSQAEQEQIRLMVKLTSILDSLDEDNRQLDNVLLQNQILNEDIITEIEGTINKVEYYELFENVLKSVISKLNDVNLKLRDENASGNPDLNRENLKDIESLYTVASERKIHNNFLNGESSIDISEDENASDDLELF